MIEMDERRPWSGCGNMMLIGPGAAGKTTLGYALAPLLKLRLVDLDQEFIRQHRSIDEFIGVKGYHAYKLANSALAAEISLSLSPLLLVTSSGFITTDNPEAALSANLKMMASFYSICLLPSRNLEIAVELIVSRQMQRPFSRNSACGAGYPRAIPVICCSRRSDRVLGCALKRHSAGSSKPVAA